MLSMWVVVLFMSGKPMATLEEPSEAACERARQILLLQQRTLGKKADAACYLRATKD
jgi:hypothetical protein